MCQITDDADEKRSYACDGRGLRAQGEGSGGVKAGVTLQSYQPPFFPPLLQLLETAGSWRRGGGGASPRKLIRTNPLKALVTLSQHGGEGVLLRGDAASK